MFCRARRSKQAFSLIELLVVITIIAILMALYLPTLSKALRKAKSTAAAEEHRQGSIGSMADSANAAPKVVRPSREDCREAYYQKKDTSQGERYYTKMLCVVKNEEQFKAYWMTVISAAASDELTFDDADNLLARDDRGVTYRLPVIPEGEFATKYGTYPIAWEFLSTKMTPSSTGDLGTTVLYSDGHTEYKPYPSDFPACRTVTEFSQLFLNTRQ